MGEPSMTWQRAIVLAAALASSSAANLNSNSQAEAWELPEDRRRLSLRGAISGVTNGRLGGDSNGPRITGKSKDDKLDEVVEVSPRKDLAFHIEIAELADWVTNLETGIKREGKLFWFIDAKTGKKVTWETALRLLKASDSTFRSALNNAIKDNAMTKNGTPFKGVDFECLPVTKNELSSSFKCGLAHKVEREYKKVNFKNFKGPINKAAAKDGWNTTHGTRPLFISFENLNKTGNLTIPLPVEGPAIVPDGQLDKEKYKHLLVFLRDAPPDVVDAVWQEVATKMQEMIDEEKKVYLNTEGMGVQWLHVRTDTLDYKYNTILKGLKRRKMEDCLQTRSHTFKKCKCLVKKELKNKPNMKC